MPVSRTVRTSGLAAIVAWALIALAGATARAQESFPSTHIALFQSNDSVPGSARGFGLGIFRADRKSGTADFRISIVSHGGAINDVYLREHTTSGIDPIISAFVYPADSITTTGTLTVDLPDIFDMLDSGRLYLDMRSVDYPDGYMVGPIEVIPNALAQELQPSEEVPVSQSSNGTGHAWIVVDRAARSARYHVEWSRLTGPATMAHFHRGAFGVIGPPAHTIAFTPGDSTTDGVWENISAEDMQAIADANMYVNVHTAQYPNGEVRGQVLPCEVFTAALEPENVAPQVTGSDATGTGYFLTVTSPVSGTFVRALAVAGGTTDTIRAVDVHRGARGQNGSVMFSCAPNGPIVWTFQRALLPDNDLPAADRALLRAGNTYMDAHTAAHPDGEIRGQLIPSNLNLTSSVPVPAAPDAGSALAAYIDAASQSVRFTIGGEHARNDCRIVLYSMLGQQVATTDVTSTSPVLSTTWLAPGLYIAQLIENGTVVGMCRVAVMEER